MEDSKRNLANSELGDILGPGILALKPEEPQNFVELAKPEPFNPESTGTMVNNFHVNLNMEKWHNQNNTERVVNDAVKNSIPSMGGSPEETKKDSLPTSPISYETPSKDNPPVLNNLENDEGRQQQELELMSTSGNPSPILDLAGLDSFEMPEMGEYNYSMSELTERVPKIKQGHEILKNVIQHSITNQEYLNVTPASSIDQSMYVEQIAGEKNYYSMNNLTVENNTNNHLETVNELSRSKDRQEKIQLQQQVQIIQQMTQQQKIQKEENDDVQEATQVNPKEGAGSVKNNTQMVRSISNMNPVPSTINTFIHKMNSPPRWRTVLG
jgi:hypothetical protein